MEPDVTIVDARPTVAVEPPLSWSAIFAGVAAALAVAILLTVLASGFGYSLSMGGLWSRATLAAFTPMLGAAAVAVQVISAGLGGYLAGRLRHHWLRAHIDEAHFRDTAHGLIVWSVATLAGVVLVSMVLAPYSERLALLAVATNAAVAPFDPTRAAQIMAQAAFFSGVGMLLAAFTAAVAARVGGERTEKMHSLHARAAPAEMQRVG